ncbi:glycoside hydrolase family 97 N-terminal domain-containing protein, partial [Candidatus Symbiothrix dinenymphae]|uniref:glycoside hydrolase family 97 N-terminal domain-containing protein n=1 Tax=Candidatus Symbiothrix dinenymphae TaxID=467085 RepID=UPI001D056F86
MFRVYDDGVAFRYKLYRSERIGNRQLTKELTTFAIPGNPDAWVVEYGGYATPNEAEFMEKKLDAVSDKTIAGLPFLMKYADDCWVAITEAEIDNFAAFYLGTNGQKNQLTTKLVPLPGEEEQGVKVRFADDAQTPWRVIMIGNTPGTLIESEIIQNLNPPCAIADPSWIKPGMSAWDNWWSGNVKMEMPVIKEYIDFASEMGWPYMLVDWQWYGQFNRSEADIIRCAADNHLLVDFHGAYKPDGIIRTYPNMLTREG